MAPPLGLLLAFAAAALSTVALARLAPRLGLLDGAAPLADGVVRKLQERPVPAVGGAAVLLALLAGGATLLEPGFVGWFGASGVGASLRAALPLPGPVAALAALCAAFAVGLVDDVVPGGLRARTKFALQCAAGTPLGVGAWLADGGAGSLALGPYVLGAGLLAAVALNAVNTFDNADGAAAGLSVIAFALPAPVAAGALLGFLPFNLDGRQRVAGAPTAYLGDSGSHLLGMLILLTPLAWPALLLPLADLLRVAVLRVRAGGPPWRGDRRHLAHMALRRGLGRGATLAMLVAVAGPALFLGGAGLAADRPVLVAVGSATTLALYALALAVAAGRSGAAPAAPRPR